LAQTNDVTFEADSSRLTDLRVRRTTLAGAVDIHSALTERSARHDQGLGLVAGLNVLDMETGRAESAASNPSRVRGGNTTGSDRSTQTILVVEDDEAIRNAVRRILEIEGYTVLPASTPMEAIDLASNRQVPIHVLLTDVGLLGVTGPQLAKLLVADRPGLRMLYISGHSEAHSVPPGRVGPGTAFLQKPFTLDALLHEVRELLDQGAPRGRAGGD
jgi:CheY-like chemotaxis protein